MEDSRPVRRGNGEVGRDGCRVGRVAMDERPTERVSPDGLLAIRRVRMRGPWLVPRKAALPARKLGCDAGERPEIRDSDGGRAASVRLFLPWGGEKTA